MKSYNNVFKSRSEYIYLPERLICAASYLTFGLAGFIWLIVSHVKKQTLSPFTKHHIFQSILLYLLISAFYMAIGLVYNIIGILPFLGNLVQNIIYLLTQFPVFIGQSLTDLIRLLLYLYLPVSAILGKDGNLPYISNIVRQIT